jgi:hypothetical protein
MSKLLHPNIVLLKGVACCPLRMVMEFCNAGDLFRAIGEGSIKQPLQVCAKEAWLLLGFECEMLLCGECSGLLLALWYCCG